MISLQRVTKRFKLYARPRDRLLEALSGKPRHRCHTALSDVDLSVQAGETLALLGRNGAGKSTLLKLITGVLLPDAGSVEVAGRVTGLLELGTGFDPRLSGRKNIYVNGLLLGLSAKELAAREAAIVEFAELGDSIDEPLKTYSSGMVMRLGFAVAAHADPKVLVVDEALAVGDARFQQKCLDWIRRFKAQGGTILLASHDLNAVKLIADRAVVLEGGRIAFDGPPDKAVAHYLKLIAGGEDRLGRPTAYGSGEVAIEDVALTGDSGRAVVACGERARLTVALYAAKDLTDVSLGFMIRDRFGQDVFGTNSYLLGQTLNLQAGRRYLWRAELRMALAPGRYTLTVAAHSGPHHLERCYHWWDNALEFEVAGVLGPLFSGLVRLPVENFELIAEPDRVLCRA
ncbi:ABC transporter ATP-binding protein [Methylothermus subterraneus]